MLQNATYFVAKSRHEYRCEKCDYNTCKRGDWNKHLETKKHKTREMLHNATDFVAKKSPKLWRCECGKVYKHHTSFYRHKNQCTQRALSEHVTPNMDGMKDLMVSMVEENRELRAILLDQQKQLAELKPHQHITNNINNTFNLHVFLNEDCKEALNMTEFIKSLDIQVQDLEHTRKHGLCAGVQNILVNALKNVGTYKRPIHCTDVKRETLYIKDANEWERVDDNREQMKKPITDIADKQRKAIKQWETAHPNWSSTDKGKDEWTELVQNVMDTVGGHTPGENRIIKGIAKEVKINSKD